MRNITLEIVERRHGLVKFKIRNSHRCLDFVPSGFSYKYPDNDAFEASNGVILMSGFSPMVSSDILFMQGSNELNDDRILEVLDGGIFEKFQEAVDEYNVTFGGIKPLLVV